MAASPNVDIYTAFEKSQVPFIPVDLRSLNDSIGDTVDVVSADKEYYEPAPSLKRLHTNNSVASKTYSVYSAEGSVAFTKISSRDTWDSTVVDTVRYKITASFSSREIMLLRTSWAFLQDDEISDYKILSFVNRINDDMSSSAIPTASTGNNMLRSSFRSRPTVHSTVSYSSSSAGSSTTQVPAFPTIIENSNNSNIVAASLFCAQFYACLLDMSPGLEKIYPSIKHQAVSFAAVVTIAISHLEHLSVMNSYLCDLGKRHSRILGIEPPDFELMGNAFIKTIKNRFGIHCTIELTEVWTRLYSFLANSILQFGIDPVVTARSEAQSQEEEFSVKSDTAFSNYSPEFFVFNSKSATKENLTLTPQDTSEPAYSEDTGSVVVTSTHNYRRRLRRKKKGDKDCIIM
ncbi:HBR550Cp [Eremothecium sinecaudum]|uniref:HBR550Cp n=1 Tax=Eremothecium sinecaudum TaxID=45286 RepID=A0A109UXP1_9SACH|nr:HBR550Cp [Eremothecium sinecaudum]AMD19451.1 HBR550Cp [Eremothecium sinecaudum]